MNLRCPSLVCLYNSLLIAVTCWPTQTGPETFEVNMEYELQRTDLQLQNVVISIPIQYFNRNSMLKLIEAHPHLLLAKWMERTN